MYFCTNWWNTLNVIWKLPRTRFFSLWPQSAQALVSFVLCIVAQSYPTLCNPMDCSPPSTFVHGDSPGKSTGVGSHALLQGVFPTQVSHTAGRFFTVWAGTLLYWGLTQIAKHFRNLLALQLLSIVTWPRFIIALKCRHLPVWSCLQIPALKVIYAISLFSQLHVK